MLRQVPDGKEAGPGRRAPGAAGQERTRRGAGDRRGAQAQSRPVRHLGPGPARPCGRSSAPLPRQPQRVRGGAGEAGSRGPQRRDSPRPPTPVRTGRLPPRAPGPRSPRAAGGGGERVGWVCPVLSPPPPPPPPLTARPGCALGRRHPRPRRAAIPALSLAATPPRFPQNPGRRAHATPASPPSRPTARKHRDAPAREHPREPREDGGGGDTRRGPGGAEDAPAGRLLGPRTHLSFSAGALAALRGASSAAGQGHAPDVSTQGTHGWVPAEVGGTKREKGLRAARAPPLGAHARGLRSLHALVGSLRLLTVFFIRNKTMNNDVHGVVTKVYFESCNFVKKSVVNMFYFYIFVYFIETGCHYVALAIPEWLCRPGCPRTQQYYCLCFQSSDISRNVLPCLSCLSLFCCCFLFFDKSFFPWVALAVLKLAVEPRLAWNSENPLPLLPGCWD